MPIGAIIGAIGAVAGGAIAAKGAKDAAATAAAGADEEIRYLEESRDLARTDTAPYREAGYTALDELGKMTGLLEEGGTFQPWKKPNARGITHGSAEQQAMWDSSPWELYRENDRWVARLPDGTTNVWNDQTSQWQSARGSAYSGAPRTNTVNRAGGGTLYNVNELGPETRYSKGKAIRSSIPTTVPGDPTGYVQPNIVGRNTGGSIPLVHVAGDVDNRARWRTGDVPMRTRLPGGKYPGGPSITTGGSGGDPNATTDLPGTESGTGIDGNQTAQPTGAFPDPVENPYDITTDPGYIFRFGEGMRALERSAAARGGLLSGGFGRKAIRYGQDYASQEFTNIYNRISNIAGLGQVGVQGGANAAIQTGAGMGNAASNRALSSAYGQMGATNAWANAANQVAQLPWDQVKWGGGSSGGTGIDPRDRGY